MPSTSFPQHPTIDKVPLHQNTHPMKNLLRLIALLLLTAPGFTHRMQAQCSAENTAFSSGETLMYDLYFNWKFMWIKVGTAAMSINGTQYDGQPAYKAQLITRTSSRADKFFVMRDTLIAYTGHDLVPYRYEKRALEGKRYTHDQATYSYPAGQCHVALSRKVRGRPEATDTYTGSVCAYDMLSMMLRARSFDASGFRKGHRIKFMMADGKRCEPKVIEYRGKKTFKMENTGTKYRCLVFTFLETEDGKEKEIVTFYITDDKNHLPVRLDMNLNFGTAKAFLTGTRGLRHRQTSKIN